MASAFCTAGKQALLESVVDHEWKAALYTSSASLDASTPAYTSDNEVESSGGYVSGGMLLTGATTGSDQGIAWITFDDVTWPSASFTARFMLIYDASDEDRAYAVVDLGSDKTGQGGNFTFPMPPSNAAEAIIRI